MRNVQTAVSPHPLKIRHVSMNLFTRNSLYYHLLKHLLFLLKHPVYMYIPVFITVISNQMHQLHCTDPVHVLCCPASYEHLYDAHI